MFNIIQRKEWKLKKKDDKDGKALYKLMKNVVYSKSMANLRNRIDISPVKNEKDYLKWILKARYTPQKYLTMIFSW